MLLEAAIFDFDGVLFDTEDLHQACWIEVASELSRSMTRGQFLRGFGVKNDFFIRHILEWTQNPGEIEAISRRKEELFQQKIQTAPLHPIEGTLQCLTSLYEKGLPCVVGTSSIGKNIDIIFGRYPHVGEKIVGVISAENVLHGKPDPEVFLLGCQLVEKAPSRTVVFEDAPLGIRAAKNGKLLSVGLLTTFPYEVLAAEKPDLLLADLSLFTPESLDESIRKTMDACT